MKERKQFNIPGKTEWVAAAILAGVTVSSFSEAHQINQSIPTPTPTSTPKVYPSPFPSNPREDRELINPYITPTPEWKPTATPGAAPTATRVYGKDRGAYGR